jgi:hypothetical protein
MLQARLNTAQWERALKELGKKNAIKAGIRAVNRTLTSSRSAVVKDVAPDVGLQQKAVRDQITVVVAKNTGQAPHGQLWATTKRVPLIQFKAKDTKRGVTAKLKGGAGRYPHAFIRTTRSGHTGVFQRTGKSRLPIYELKGPSLYHAFQKHAPVAQSRALEVLDKNFGHELSYMLSKAKQ